MAITDIKDVNTWEDYEEYVRNTDPEAWKIHEQAHKFAEAVSFIMESAKEWGETVELKEINPTRENSDSLPKYFRPRKVSKYKSYNSAAKSRKLRARLLRLQRV